VKFTRIKHRLVKAQEDLSDLNCANFVKMNT